MSTTKIIFAPELTGATGLLLYLQNEAGALVNPGGDSLTESPSGSGRFMANVAESLSEIVNAVVRSSNGIAVREGWLEPTSDLIIPNYPSATVSGGPNGTGQFLTTVTVTTESGIPIAGALVTVQFNNVPIAWGHTGNSGEVAFNLDPGNYTFLFSAMGFVSGINPRTVSSNNAFSALMPAQSITPPPVGQFASIFLVCLRGAAAVPNAVVTVELEDQASTITAGAQMKMVGTFVANNLGAGTLVLPWSSSFRFGDGIFTVSIKDPLDGQVFHTRRIIVPDVSTANYYELPSPL